MKGFRHRLSKENMYMAENMDGLVSNALLHSFCSLFGAHDRSDRTKLSEGGKKKRVAPVNNCKTVTEHVFDMHSPVI